MKRKIIIALTLLILLGLAGGGYIIKKSNKTINAGNSFFIVKEDDTFETITVKLKERNIINSKSYLTLCKTFKGNSFKISPGNYIISPNTTMSTLLDTLSSGLSDFAVVTIPEGFSVYQIAERLEKNNLVKKEDFLTINIKDLNTQNIIQTNEGSVYSLEGYLFPDTYYIPYTYTKEQIAQTMVDNFLKAFPVQYIDRANELGITVNQVITIASLIEKEASNDSERSRISGVIYNRLKIGMPLQIDASVIYAINKGQKSISNLTLNDLKTESPYNSYSNKPLPPGPIASPGKPSIDAALYPETHEYLYYVLGDDGHVFSKTYEEHKQNIEKYRSN